MEKPPSQSELEEFVRRTKAEPIVSSQLHRPDMGDLIDEFVQDLPARVRRMERALAADDRALLGSELRNLRGEAGGFGFEPITAAAGEVEALTADAKSTCADLRRALGGLVRMCLAARPASCQTPLLGMAVVAAIDPNLAEENAAAMDEAADGGLGIITPTGTDAR